MRCPNCGAFIEDGKTTCFMCGTDINNFNNGNNQNNGFSSGFSNNKQVTNYNMPNNNFTGYTAEPVKDKDFFDFISEHSTLVKFIVFILVVGIIGLVGWKYYGSKTKALEHKPILNDLYYSVDKSLTNNNSGNGGNTYSLSSDKGAACNISVKSASSTSENQIDEYLKASENTKIGDWDEFGNNVEGTVEFISQEGSMEINGTTWYYLNLFYKSNNSDNYDTLKYRYMGALNKGFFYNVELVNSNNDATCGTVLDAFARSLEFTNKE